MKKTLLLVAISLLLLFTGACGANSGTNVKTKNPDSLTVYTTVYPLTYFTERIGGDHVNVESVYPAGSNEHTFDPTQKDMMSLADADLFFYIGLGLEGFVENAKKTLEHENVTMIATADSVPDDLLSDAEHDEHDDGESEESHDAHDNGESEESQAGHEGHDHGEIDPHLWISPLLSIHLASSIKDALIEKDEDHAEVYNSNFEELKNELVGLDKEFEEMANSSKNKTFFVSHSAFGYLAKSYHLEQVAVAGLNSQDEPSQKELTEIVDLAKEKNITTILFEQNVTSSLAEVIQNEVGAEALTMHNLGVLTQEDLNGEETYFTLMRENLKTLQQALNSTK
jgi:zinc transport system substrate-binding protein